MTHSLRTGGDLDFDVISWVVPWIETHSTSGSTLMRHSEVSHESSRATSPMTTFHRGRDT
jgi:hypothetical protein